MFVLLGYFFGGIPVVQEHFELLIVGIVAVSIIPTIVGIVRGRMSKGEKNNEEAADKEEDKAK